MLKAVEYEILRGVKANGLKRIPLEREPVRVATLIREDKFMEEQMMQHNHSVFLEDRMHDWDWQNGQFRYYTRVAEIADVLIVYKVEDVKPAKRFDPETGMPLSL